MLGQSVVLEENHFFTRAAPTITGKIIDLRKAIVVTSTALSISPKTIGLVLPGSKAIFVDFASLSPSPKAIGLNKSWSIPITKAAISALGQNTGFNFTIVNGVRVDPVLLRLTTSNITFALQIKMPVNPALPSISPKTIGFRRDWILAFNGADISPSAGNVGLSFTYTLGTPVTPAYASFSPGQILLYLGSGEPEKIKIIQSSPSIQISMSAPYATSTIESGSIQSG
jgi:hypothetical protein